MAFVKFNEDQIKALKAIEDGLNIFLTGPAGTGKSTIIKEVNKKSLENGKNISVTAMTGCAALLLTYGAKTIHSWAGVGLAKESKDVLAGMVMKNPKSKKRWKKTDILVIDEISMMTVDLLQKLDYVGKQVRADSRPFGGIQLVLCGDYYQLPPICTGRECTFAFECETWRNLKLQTIELKIITRQTDIMFQKVLNEARIGELSEESIEILMSRKGLDWKSKQIRPTLLFSKNKEVDAINEKNIVALMRPLTIFEAKTVTKTDDDKDTKDGREDDTLIPTGELLDRVITKLDNDAVYMPSLSLCIGAQVMLVTNLDLSRGLANGSRGMIVGFRAGDNIPIVQFQRGDPVAIEYQIWFSPDFPKVGRKQIPLRIAYAITIHKCQGATLDCALIDIGKNTFEYGQAYVALSRVRSLESLYIYNFDARRVLAHPKVKDFYKSLECEKSITKDITDKGDNVISHVDERSESPFIDETDYEVDTKIDISESDKIKLFEETETVEMKSYVSNNYWNEFLNEYFDTKDGKALEERIIERRKVATVYPPEKMVYSCLEKDPKEIKVVLLGQDPYHGEGQAIGLSFAVGAGTPFPPSLKNIRKEYLDDLGKKESDWSLTKGTLSSWVSQGVLLLNAVLTVEKGNANAHSGFGYEQLTRMIIRQIVIERGDKPIVFIAWGRYAQDVIKKAGIVEYSNAFVIESAHPSPLSARHGFFGSKPFSKTNAILESKGESVIDWTI